MRNVACSVLACLLLDTNGGRSEEESDLIYLHSLKLGQKGRLNERVPDINLICALLIDEVLSDDEVMIRDSMINNPPRSKTFGKQVGRITRAVVEMPTKGLVDGAPFEPPGVLEVVRTKKTKKGTVFVLRPVVKKK
ncbi:MAG: hypothetical protein K2W96_09800 [Gemmataceae bacterium]|nr:hypothetical protein [Gemmataceae bacterium]